MTRALFILTSILACLLGGETILTAQEVPILNYSTLPNGQVQLEVNSSSGSYYILRVKHHPDSLFEFQTSMTLGQEGSTIITEPLAHYPEEHYRVLEYPLSDPADSDGDGQDDLSEFTDIPHSGPFNVAGTIDSVAGQLVIQDLNSFEALSAQSDIVQWSEYLNGKKYVKFLIADFYTEPRIYFIDANTYSLHLDFGNTIGIDIFGDDIIKGQISYHPTTLASSGVYGTFAFNFSNAEGHEFSIVQRTQELLAINMPFIENNLSYFITENNEEQLEQELSAYEDSRVSVLFESDIYAGLDYWGLHQTEGYGIFRHISGEEVPGPRDIVLYDALPNNLPRVGGIMTSVIQTPLSHVNLRAIQNNIPNAFVRDPLLIDSIASLIDHYVYYKVEQSSYTLREASLDEVNEWYEHLRPNEEQVPPLDLTYTEILPLGDISFDMYDGFGAKCANIATMRSFGFPEQTIPDGFGVPFYYYTSFMEYNDFFQLGETMMSEVTFEQDRNVRDSMLLSFRQLIRSAEMPPWMMDELGAMHTFFPDETSIRCRSSSNNEDLPGFNGAGLYDSKTQHPDEGHISKSIKQVYASLWNLRAFEERDFFRVDHFSSAMAVLCHPNYTDEKLNGVAVSSDPFYSTEDSYYLNTQLGEDLITNPGTNSIPEELLIYTDSGEDIDYSLIQYSNLLTEDSLLMSDQQLVQLRDYLTVIHQNFEQLYDAEDNATFAMDIEYKVTSENQLIIKQARPWINFVPTVDDPWVNAELYSLSIYPNPANTSLRIRCVECKLSRAKIYDISGKLLISKPIEAFENEFSIDLQVLAGGVYILRATSDQDINLDTIPFIKLAD